MIKKWRKKFHEKSKDLKEMTETKKCSVNELDDLSQIILKAKVQKSFFQKKNPKIGDF